MAYLSNAPLKSTELIEEVNNMEKEMDRLESILPKLTRFILPQGSESAVRLHIARSKIRTAERRIVEFVDNKKTQITEDLLIMKYINRLSDFFFMLARKYSNEEKVT
jgi:cob(I)alamin adenosyltransferase